ncbi:MAG TPA: TRAFs-binding domain-containing protein [Kofleriaceae bacterium]
MTGKEQYHVFLSYRSVNRTWVLNLYDVLHQQGFEVFLDQVALTGGDELIKKLEQGLTHSQAGILIWSSASADSDWVRKEYQTLERQATKSKSFRFVPVLLDASELPAFAADRVFLDFRSYPDGPNGGELLRLLYSIVGQPLTPEAAHFAAEQDAVAKQQANEVVAAVHLKDHERLQELFAAGGLPWETSSALGCKAAEGLIELGKNTEAIAMLEALRARFPRAIRPKQLHALALARRAHGSDLRDAQRILAALYADGERDPETLGIYGRTWMDRFTLSQDRADLEQSRNLYAEAFEKATDDYYTGVNAAAKSVFLGTPEDLERAEDYARRVQDIVGTTPRQGDYWMTATVGEVLLMQKNYRDAASVYKAGVAMALAKTASHLSTWRQAHRLMEKLQPSPEERTLIRNAFAHLPDPPPP